MTPYTSIYDTKKPWQYPVIDLKKAPFTLDLETTEVHPCENISENV